MLPHFQVLSALVALAVPWVQKEQDMAPPLQLDCLLHPNPFRGHSTLPPHVPSLGPEDMRCAFLVYLSAPLQHPQPGSLCSSKLGWDLPFLMLFIPSKGDWMTLFSEIQLFVSFSYLWFNEGLLIITSVVLTTKGIIMRFPEEAAVVAEAEKEFSASEALPGSLAQWLPWSVICHREHFIFILIKL